MTHSTAKRGVPYQHIDNMNHNHRKYWNFNCMHFIIIVINELTVNESCPEGHVTLSLWVSLLGLYCPRTLIFFL